MPETVEFHRSVKYAIYPDAEQVGMLARTFGCTRKVWNLGLEMQNGLYQSGMPSLSQNALNDYCNHVWKDDYPWLRDVDKFVLTNSICHLDSARKNFWAGRCSKAQIP